MLDEGWKDLDRIRFDDELVVLGSDMFGNSLRISKLAKILVLKPDRKSLHGLRTLLCHQRHDSRRIHAAREEGAERNFRDQTETSRFAKQPRRFFDCLVF